ncbi:MAG: multidrug efflux system outer membrane protein [Bradymonadia bacterium]|jgi:multidrug efflux system outer membrane protein
MSSLFRRAAVGTVLVAGLALTAPPAQAQSVLSLEEALEASRSSSFDAQEAQLNIDAAEAALARAYALVLPNVELGATYTLNDQEITLGFPNPLEPIAPFLDTIFDEFGGDPDRGLFDPAELAQSGDPAIVQNRHDVGASLTVTQTLFNARALPAIRLVRHNIVQAEQGADQVAYMVEGAVIQAYFGAILSKQVVRLRQRSRELVQLSYDRAVAAFEAEVGNRFEVTRAEVELRNAERDVDNARLAAELAIEGLATLLNIDPGFEVQQPRSLDSPSSVVLELPGMRPDLEAFSLAIQRQELLLKETQAQWYPLVFARFNTSLRRQTAFGGDPLAWNLQVGLTWTLYDGGVRRAERQSREVDLARVELQRERLEHQISADLRNLSRRIEQERSNSVSATAERDLAQENLELAEQALSLGVVTALDVRAAREQLEVADLAVVTSGVSLQQLLYERAWRVDDPTRVGR